jgi:hypothetical protein
VFYGPYEKTGVGETTWRPLPHRTNRQRVSAADGESLWGGGGGSGGARAARSAPRSIPGRIAAGLAAG